MIINATCGCGGSIDLNNENHADKWSDDRLKAIFDAWLLQHHTSCVKPVPVPVAPFPRLEIAA